jgi:alkaline phosphatase D
MRGRLGYPFTLGVASGEPAPDGVVLWTRLLPSQGPPAEPVEVRWELARDEKMSDVLRRGVATAQGDEAHSVHIEVDGLEPDRWYWYRFTAIGEASPIGRTRTAPAPGAMPAKLRFAFASCQQWEHGYYAAHRDIASRAPDLVAFLGDYIYERGWGSDKVRSYDGPETVTLEQYRARHALHKSDEDLQAAHAAAPWIVTWDDHEVVDDWADDRARGASGAAFLARRAAAFQAFWEHMPLRRASKPNGAQAQIFRRIEYGDLATFHVLDDRQYRTHQACTPEGGSRTLTKAECPALDDPQATLLGWAQERWLEDGLSASRARWNILAQQTRMARRSFRAPEQAYWNDGWDGYFAARRRLLDFLATRRPNNPLVIGGDIHAFFAADLRPDFDRPETPPVATEVIGSSISSQSGRRAPIHPADPHIRFDVANRRGYAEVTITPGAAEVEMRAVDNPRERSSPVGIFERIAVEGGRAGANVA